MDTLPQSRLGNFTKALWKRPHPEQIFHKMHIKVAHILLILMSMGSWSEPVQ